MPFKLDINIPVHIRNETITPAKLREKRTIF